jgi:hypothetical protein
LISETETGCRTALGELGAEAQGIALGGSGALASIEEKISKVSEEILRTKM